MLPGPDGVTPSWTCTTTTTGRTSRVISDARAHAPEVEDATDPVDDVITVDAGTVPAGRDEALDDAGEEGGRTGPRLALPLVPLLAGLLALLLAALAFLWFTRPGPSDIRTADYARALQAARSAVVDVTSFDHLTIDDDIEQIRRVTTGDLRDEAVEELDGRRQEITRSEAVVNTEVGRSEE